MERLVEDEDDKKTSISSDDERIVSLNTQEIDQMDSVPQTIQMAYVINKNVLYFSYKN